MASLAVLPRIARADVSSQIRVAVIGINGRGRNHIEAFANNLVALCDCDRNVLGQRAYEFEQRFGRKPDQVVDFRELLDQNDIDAVLIATGPNWHATASMYAAKAGKDIYCEKPVSTTIGEAVKLPPASNCHWTTPLLASMT